MFNYIKYFFYIAFNWNIRIAYFIIKEEIKGEKQYGINTTGADELKALQKKGIEIEHATIYMPVSYSLLEECFKQLNNQTFKPLQQHFLDLGCGRGRALCVAAHNGFNKITGIDFSKELCTAANENLMLTKQKNPSIEYKVINNDAFYFEIPTDADCIFMFNPFDDVIMNGVAENILESFEINPRDIYIIYVNPLYKEELTNLGFKQVYHTKKMKYLEAIILELKK